jgi:ABC-2 type transport system permease protein
VLGIHVQWQYTPLIAAGVVSGTAGWFFFLSIFALRIRRNDMFNTVLNLFYFVLMFASTMFYPLDGMPVWLRTVSTLNPLTWHTDALRYLTIGAGTPGDVIIKAAAFFVFLVVSFGIAVRTLQRGILR